MFLYLLKISPSRSIFVVGPTQTFRVVQEQAPLHQQQHQQHAPPPPPGNVTISFTSFFVLSQM